MRAIREVELRRFELGATATALRGYADALRQPGRYIQLEGDLCSCCDPLESRDILEVVLRQLPRPARRDLARIVDRIDAEFLRRTLPDPFAVGVSAWQGQAWWRQRLRER